jgi:proline iminopeptidase
MAQSLVTRRHVCALGLGLASCSALAAVVPANLEAARRRVRGTRLYVEVSGPPRAPAMLYLHGGPGTGSYDFSLYQRQRLSGALRLIALDQRGVLRSDAIPPGMPFGFDDLVEDCEALRRALNIERWAVLGHSFGGYLAMAYALRYPGSLSRVIFENPTWDFNTTGRYLLRLEAPEFARLGRSAEAQQALKAADAAPQTPTADVWEDFSRLTNELGKSKDTLYVHGPDKRFFDQLVAQSGLPEEQWHRGMRQQRLLYEEGKVFMALTPRFADLELPSLLIKGRYDPVTPPDQVDAYVKHAKGAQVRVYESSSHFVHVEEPDAFARTVSAYVRDGTIPEGQGAAWNGVPSA